MRPHWPFQVLCVLVAVVLTAAVSVQFARAQRAGVQPISDKPNRGTLSERLNANTIAIVSGNVNATYLTIAYDLSDVLDNGNNFRILPVIGKGGGQNIRDVRFLKGIDLGITQSIILNEFRESKEIGNIDDQIVYIAKLFSEEMHVVVRADSGIDTLEQLNGKTVNFSDVGSGSQLSTRDIFRRLGIQAQEVNMGQGDALEKLKSGDISATILIAGKPAGAMGKLRAADGFRFLPVAFAKPLQTDYLPVVLSHDDYPEMVETGHDINTARGQRRAHRLQLAAGFGSLPPHCPVCGGVFSQDRRTPEAAAPSKVARDQSCGRIARVDAISGGSRMARPKPQAASDDSHTGAV